MLFWHSVVTLTLWCPMGTLPITISVANRSLSVKVKGSVNSRFQQKSLRKQRQAVAMGDLNRRHAGRVVCGFRKLCCLSSLPRAEVTDPTQGLHRLLGKVGGKSLGVVSVGADDFFNWRPFWFYLSFCLYSTKCLYWVERAYLAWATVRFNIGMAWCWHTHASLAVSAFADISPVLRCTVKTYP